MKKLLLLFAFSFSLLTVCKAQITGLYDFNGSQGNHPYGQVVLSGNKLYGVASNGGAHAWGCIFSVDTTGLNYKDLYDFNTTNGETPFGSLILDGTNLYGMTQYGGANGEGVLFSIDTNGTGYHKLIDFGNNPYGAYPNRNDMLAVGKTLYGVTWAGGLHYGGCIFAIDTDGNRYRKLYDFTTATGSYPTGALIRSGKMLYGMTQNGGTMKYGVVYSIDTNGNNYRDIHNFDSINGKWPAASLIQSGKTLLGMVSEGGATNQGVIFSLDTNGTGYKVLLNFNGTNGAFPYGSFALSGSMLYGMTYIGGASGDGNIFSIDTGGSAFTDMYDFNGGPTGKYPWGSLTLSGGNMFVMTNQGGVPGVGNIFSFQNTPNGIDGLNMSTEVKLYPNPNSGIFTIQETEVRNQNSVVEIYNMLGEKVYLTQYSHLTTQISIDLSNQPSGIYLYRLLTETGNLVSAGKFIIQK
jgi:uncharacterized repeat protein (TIGR03803 family)